jgi:class 3 adenylate cyclase
VLDQFSEWFWRQFRQHYFLAIFGVTVVSLAVSLLIPLVFIVGPSFDLTRSESVSWATAALIGGVLATALGIVTSRSQRGQIKVWVGGDHDHPREMRDAILVLPESMAMRAGVLGAPYYLIVAGPLLADYAGFGVRGYIATEAMAMIALSLAAFLAANGLRILTRPILQEVAALMPIDVVPTRRTWDLRTVFGVSTYIAAVSAGTISTMVTQRFNDSREEALFAGVLTAVLIGAYGTLVNRIGLVEPSFRPLDDLKAAAERVAAGNFTEPMAVTSTDQFSEIALAINRMMVGLQQRDSLQTAFGSYVDPSLTRRLLEQDTSIFAGEAVEATVFFADVRGFTNYAQSVEPDEAVTRLNLLFDIVVPVIRDAGGHANRYIGDGVLAVFGTPEPLANLANMALTAAVAIQREVQRAFGGDVQLGIGINTGKVIAGTIGGGGKLDFTVIGDVVNVASRMEELTKTTGDCILVTQETLDNIRFPSGAVIDRGKHVLRGRTTPTQVFAIET